MAQQQTSVTYPTREAVDFVIVGSGAAGGVMAKELSGAGFSVVVLEQGPHLKAGDFRHDEWSYDYNGGLIWGSKQGHPQTFRKSATDTANRRRPRWVMHTMWEEVAFIFPEIFGACGPSTSKRRVCAEPLPAQTSPTGPLATKSLNPIIRKSIGRLAYQAFKALGTHRDRRITPANPCPLRAQMYFLSALEKN